MRVYKNLHTKSKAELIALKDIVATNSYLTKEEIEANMNMIEQYLNPVDKNQILLQEIEDGRADIDDIG